MRLLKMNKSNEAKTSGIGDSARVTAAAQSFQVRRGYRDSFTEANPPLGALHFPAGHRG